MLATRGHEGLAAWMWTGQYLSRICDEESEISRCMALDSWRALCLTVTRKSVTWHRATPDKGSHSLAYRRRRRLMKE